jgi:hypothetical protein
MVLVPKQRLAILRMAPQCQKLPYVSIIVSFRLWESPSSKGVSVL